MVDTLDRLFVHANALLNRSPWIIYLLLTLWFTLVNFPDQVLVRNYGAIAFPLESLVISKLLFAGHAIRPEIGATLIEASNAALIYPPGLYVLEMLLGSVRNMFLFLFLVQAVVPALIYRLFRTVTAPAIAFLVAVLGSYYFVKTNWWTPDFIIQPLSILALMLLGVGGAGGQIGRRNIILAGMITGLIIVLKHNIGIFFAITCGTWLFLSAFIGIGRPALSPRLSRWAAMLGLAAFTLFGLIFARRTIHWDERIFYLLPYALFLLAFARIVIQERPNFQMIRFLCDAVLFGITGLLLPGYVFIKFGEVFGYGRYWFSLTGMGFRYLAIWDPGITTIIVKSLSLTGIAMIYQSLAAAFLYLVPFLAGLYVTITILRMPRDGDTRLDMLRYGAIGIMASFMMFPLESVHILQTKLFFFLLPTVLLLARRHARAQAVVALLLTIAAVPVLGYALAKPIGVLRAPATLGDSNMARTINIPIVRSEADGVAGQLAVLRRTVAGSSYYVIDSTGGTLIGLASMIESPKPQYYIEMRDGILDQAVTDQALRDIADRSYAVVYSGDYDSFRQGKAIDPQLRELLTFINAHFTVVDQYQAPNKRGPDNHILGFKVFRRN